MKNGKPTPFTFVPDHENRKWLEHASTKNRRSMSAEIKIALEAARNEDKHYEANQGK